MTDIAIIGCGFAGNVAAAYFRKKLPHLSVTVIGTPDTYFVGRPVVGESTIEPTSYFLHQIGVTSMLEEKHYHKYGLTFYHKQNLGNPECRRYVVHEAPGLPRLPSYQINREVFDHDMVEHNKALGVEFIPARVKEVMFSENGGSHELVCTPRDGDDSSTKTTIRARWVIDASGRRSFLARKLGLRRPPTSSQRSAFWFRLEGFDPNFLSHMEAIKQSHGAYDSYYATHHFFAEGYWIWVIPLRSSMPRNLISVGITWRPDMCPDIRNLDQFLTHVAREHPILTDFTKSGHIVDTQLYLNYMYESSRYYHPKGWFLLGDAAFMFDPLFSNGMMFAGVQTQQIAAIIKHDAAGTLPPDYIDIMNACIEAMYARRRWTVSHLFDFFDKPVTLAWSMARLNAGYFRAGLPALLAGLHTDPRWAKEFTRNWNAMAAAIKNNTVKDSYEELAKHVQARVSVSNESVPNYFVHTVDHDLWRSSAETVEGSAAAYLRVAAGLRYRLARMAAPSVAARQRLLASGEYLLSLALRAGPGRSIVDPQGIYQPDEFLSAFWNGVREPESWLLERTRIPDVSREPSPEEIRLGA